MSSCAVTVRGKKAAADAASASGAGASAPAADAGAGKSSKGGGGGGVATVGASGRLATVDNVHVEARVQAAISSVMPGTPKGSVVPPAVRPRPSASRTPGVFRAL
jgi:hypothetical protein